VIRKTINCLYESLIVNSIK